MTETPAPPAVDAAADDVEVLLLTGMSGAGRSTAANALEDMDWYVVDNLPLQMIPPLVDLVARADGSLPKVAVVTDVRTRQMFSELKQTLTAYRAQGLNIKVLFLDASDEALVRRFESVRRPHPLQGEGTLTGGISEERRALAPLRDQSDILIDTSDFNVHQLRARVHSLLGGCNDHRLRLTVQSFGFKYGAPVDADHMADVRFLPNPYWIPELRRHNGTEEPVRDFVLGQDGALTFLDRYLGALDVVIEGYKRENRSHMTVAIGCTGGKHRSVVMSEMLGRRLAERPDTSVTVRHRDLGRE